MINVQPFLDRLEDLKLHMDFYIEVLYASQYFSGNQIIEESEKGLKWGNNPHAGIVFFDQDGKVRDVLTII